jgi:hypothetical protein
LSCLLLSALFAPLFCVELLTGQTPQDMRHL